MGCANVSIKMKWVVSEETAQTLDRLAAERKCSTGDLFLEGVGLLHVIHEASRDGRFIGVSRHRDNLETILISPPCGI